MIQSRVNLCSGSKPWHDVYNVDINPSLEPDWCGDVLNFKDKKWEVVFASPPCQYLSKVRARWGYPQPETLMAQKVFEFCLNYAKRNGKYYLIENPPGLASKIYPGSKMIHYSAYGANIKKPTMIWTNIIGFEYKLDNKRCRKFESLYRDSYRRSIIPEEFIYYVEDLLSCYSK